jgi:single-stranded-DNA-specific exonuclease
VAGIDIGAAIHQLAAEGLLLRGGGHRMAAGLTVAEARIEAAMARLAELLARQGAGAAGPADLPLDGLLMPPAATLDLVELIEAAGPFGAAAPAPRFAFAGQGVTSRRIGTGHLKISFGDETGRRVEGVAFGAFDGPLGALLETGTASRFHLAGRLERHSYNGRTTVQFRLEDAARA